MLPEMNLKFRYIINLWILNNIIIYLTLFQHTHFLRDAKEKEPEVVLIGDSLIRNMVWSPVSHIFL